jgi:hypothetical protein
MFHSTSRSGRGKWPFRRTLIAIPFACGSIALAAAAQEVVVKVDRVWIQPRKSGVGKPVTTAQRNERLTVLAPSQNGWLHVRTQQGQEGYVKEGALTGLAFSTGGKVSGDAVASPLEAHLAGKGELEKTAQQFASQNGVNRAAVEHMMTLQETTSPEAMDEWQRAGRVGPYKGQ